MLNFNEKTAANGLKVNNFSKEIRSFVLSILFMACM